MASELDALVEDEFLDFGAFDAEHKAAPLIVRNLLGRDWELPGVGQLKADFTLKQTAIIVAAARKARKARVDLSKGELLPAEDMLELAGMMTDEEMNEGLIGKENLDEMRRLGITDDQLRHLVQWLQRKHQRGAIVAEPDGDPDEDGPTSETKKPKTGGSRQKRS